MARTRDSSVKEERSHAMRSVPVPGQERRINIHLCSALTGLDRDVLGRTWMSAQDEAFRIERLDDGQNCAFPQQVILAVQFDPHFVAEDVRDWYGLLDRLRVFVIRRRHLINFFLERERERKEKEGEREMKKLGCGSGLGMDKERET
ncbi:LOW QUALITY PROTEIN: hypothetical protein TorRG33x02_180280 [Trema orientale]|uniref:Uncharacterized protein n=1 Tax=Trema orientale TaxID=63057 RepID=A0A2P5EKU4_TREOI|nr:LOW QUALITY PROTEIN: hypothetical protein TorRG33x02_180280 [Trema orientale]